MRPYKPRKPTERLEWTQPQLRFLADHYATMPIDDLCKNLGGRTRASVHSKAQKLGLSKSERPRQVILKQSEPQPVLLTPADIWLERAEPIAPPQLATCLPKMTRQRFLIDLPMRRIRALAHTGAKS